ncbi:hypothetical protein THRCLA_20028 [Thraustotheca clavata]|uniref:ATP-binding Cassette (ABC) Superfamily n=1 Tax=Thraustotheca clavata TaxID=74557 RepID=A0A1W0ACB5_9STRA|nr:hypothetical protein THRCLA_20028 [Thraustotheca clavata]
MITNDQFGSLTQGECKRVTIGGELLSNPITLFLDEPTTGLDSWAATILMGCQPFNVLFDLFDKLLSLKSGGDMVYFGGLGVESCEI